MAVSCRFRGGFAAKDLLYMKPKTALRSIDAQHQKVLMQEPHAVMVRMRVRGVPKVSTLDVKMHSYMLVLYCLMPTCCVWHLVYASHLKTTRQDR